MRLNLDFTKLLGIVTVAIVMHSLFQLTIFYSFFHIEISHFIDPGEILVISSKNITNLIFSSIIISILFFRSFFSKQSFSDLRNLVMYTELNINEKLKVIFSTSSIYYKLLICIMLIGLHFYKDYTIKAALTNSPDAYWVLIIIVGLTLILPYIQFEFYSLLSRKKRRKGLLLQRLTLARFVILIVLLSTLSTAQNVNNLRVKSLHKSVNFVYHERAVSTSAKLIYIGKTSKYLFIFNTTSNSTQVYEVENIIDLKFSK